MSSRNAPPQGRCVTTLKTACLHTRVRLDFETQITSFAVERKNRKTDFIFQKFVLRVDFNLEIQIRISWVSFFYRFIGKSEKDLQNYSREQWSFLCKLCVGVQDHCVLEKRFSNPFADFPIKRKETRKSRTDVSRSIRFYGSSRLCCNPKFRISQSKSRFPNRAHPQ